MEQKCSCLTDKKECLVHGDVVAFGVLFTYIGRKKMIPGIHVNSYIMRPIKSEVRFFASLYQAVAEASIPTGHSEIETVIFKRENGQFRDLTYEEIEEVREIEETLELEVAGI